MNDSSILQFLFLISFVTIFWPLILPAKSKAGQLISTINILSVSALIFYIFQSINTLNNLPDLSTLNINGFGITFSTNKLGIIFAMLIGVLWPISYIYSIGYLTASNEKNHERFLFFLNLSCFAGILLCFAKNIITLFICYEFLSLCTIPLVAHNSSDHVTKSTKKYITYLFGGSLLFWLPSIIFIYFSVDSGEFIYGGIPEISGLGQTTLSILVLCTIIGIAKAAIFPMHSWLPAAMAANYPTSSLLHAVLVVNAGIYSLYKFVYEVFGASIVSLVTSEAKFIILMPLIGVIYAGFLATIQKTVKKMLAWSTVSQLNLIALITLSGIEHSDALSYQSLIMHSFSKITLFFVCGCIYIRTRATSLLEFRETAYKYKVVFLSFCIGSVCLSGLPIINNGFLKSVILSTSNDLGIYYVAAGMIASSILSVIYLGRVIVEMSSKFPENYKIDKFGVANNYMIWAYVLTAAISLTISMYTKDINYFILEFLG
jgi:multicomponent Na+:H+ antiporter subunit D